MKQPVMRRAGRWCTGGVRAIRFGYGQGQHRGLLANPDRTVDTSDIPEWTEEMWKRAVRGGFIVR